MSVYVKGTTYGPSCGSDIKENTQGKQYLRPNKILYLIGPDGFVNLGLQIFENSPICCFFGQPYGHEIISEILNINCVPIGNFCVHHEKMPFMKFENMPIDRAPQSLSNPFLSFL